MKSIKGPAILLAQFAGDAAPFNTFDSICGWAASLGYKGVQIPAWDSRFIDLKKAAGSVGYCQELIGTAKKHGCFLRVASFTNSSTPLLSCFLLSVPRPTVPCRKTTSG